MSVPDFSIITPTYRRNRELVEAVDSVLTQQGVTVEVIVLDDSPEGAAADVMARHPDPRVRYVRRSVPSKGKPALVRNEGIAMASGRYLQCLDDDDRTAPGALAAVKAAFERRPDAGVAAGRIVCFGSEEDAELVRTQRARYDWASAMAARWLDHRWIAMGISMFRTPIVLNSALFIRRDLAVKLGGFDATMRAVEDVDLFVRAARATGSVFVDHLVLEYRIAGNSMLRQQAKEGFVALREGFERMHRKYKDERGQLEYRALQVFSKLLPITVPKQ